jgi:Carboxypeptidase regulatory-like domain
MLSLWLIAGPSNELHAQNATTGGLTGVVIDPNGAVVKDVAVTLQDNAKGTTITSSTNAAGAYLFSFLFPSSYTITAAHPGFRTVQRKLNILLGPPATLNIQLAIASATTTIDVTDDAPLIQAENGDASTTMNRLQVSELPNPGNDLTYVVQTAPGAIMNTDGGTGNFSVLGMPGTSNRFTVDGMNDNDDTVRVNDCVSQRST